ncbi:MAG: transcription termination/antitermination protein NusG [Holosporales bacterium]|nr:transcription termination/antitermination protein NusG [Holosporales bacterium]
MATIGNDAKWYVINVHSGLERKVVQLIKEQAAKDGVEEKFEELLIPIEEVIEVKNGEKVKVDKKYFPGYILAKVRLDGDVLHVIRSIPKVSGFLGSKGKPNPISQIEVDRILKQVKDAMESPRSTISYEIGDQVKVLDGPFASFSGFVEEVEDEKQRLKVSVMIFGRATPIALDYAQVVKV